jgi:hypothetical protein
MTIILQVITKGNVSLLGKLDGITNQVVENLAQPEIIRNNCEIVGFIPLPQVEIHQLLSGSIPPDAMKK